MADHDDARGTLTDDPVDTHDDAGDNPGRDSATRRRAENARVVRRKPTRLGALKRKVAQPVRTRSSADATESADTADDSVSTREDAADIENEIAEDIVEDEVAESGDAAAPRPGDAGAQRRPGRSKRRGRLRRWFAPRALAIVVATVLAAAVCITAGLQWKGLQADQDARDERQAFLQAGRQGALNLTTIRWDNADSDVQRILDGAGDPFRKDFADRSKSFIAVVKEAKSTSTGEITEAGIASLDGNTAQVIVAATVKTSNVGAAEQEPRAWRMKVSVEKKDNRMLVTNVEFVP